MKKNYYLPTTEIIPHITLECIQSTIISGNKTPQGENNGEEPI